jgi:hypothetical protein
MTRADRILILVIVCTLPFLYTQLWFGSEPADYVLIRSGSNDPVTETLQHNRRLHFAGPLGESVIEIRDGRTRFVSSPCKSQVCVHSGWLSSTGEFTACLPNRISLTLSGQYRHFDAINF